jgi:hypothetical protein
MIVYTICIGMFIVCGVKHKDNTKLFSVRGRPRMFGIVARSRAYKHVPLLERERENSNIIYSIIRCLILLNS